MLKLAVIKGGVGNPIKTGGKPPAEIVGVGATTIKVSHLIDYLRDQREKVRIPSKPMRGPLIEIPRDQV